MKKETLQWHPGFFAALQIELEEEQDKLLFENEHQLSEKPMAIDTLVIKVKAGESIRKNIGQIFLQHNIIEYKSPDDYLSINDYYKVLGYTCFYQSNTVKICRILPEELTITFVCSHMPQKLLKHLERFQNVCAEQAGEGIYYLKGTMFPTQILVTNQLSKADNFWLSRLRTDLEVRADLDPLSKAYKRKRKDPRYEAVMDLVIRANRKKAEEVKYMCQAIRELFADEWKEIEAKMALVEAKAAKAEANAKEAEANAKEAEANAKGVGEARLAELLQRLEAEQKPEELRKAIMDKEYRHFLYRQFGL